MDQRSVLSSFSGIIEAKKKFLESRRKEVERKRKSVDTFKTVFERYNINRAFLFGSVLGASCSPESDIDIYVENVSGEDYWALWRDLEETANQSVDLYCQLDDPVFVARIKERGELIYESRC